MVRVYFLLLVGLLLTGFKHLRAQSFTVPHDTVYATVAPTGTMHDDITNITSAPMKLKWRVAATNFPADWLAPIVINMCDNRSCIPNTGDTTLWRTVAGLPGSVFFSDYYAPSVPGVFDLNLDLTTASSVGSYWLTALITDTATSYSKNVTFVINNLPMATAEVARTVAGPVLFPNPANNVLHIDCRKLKNAGSILLFGSAGRLLNVYTAKDGIYSIDLSDLAAGRYFVRVVDEKSITVFVYQFIKE